MAAPATPEEIAEEKRQLRQECEKHIEFLDRLYKQIETLRSTVAALENDLQNAHSKAGADAETRAQLQATIASLEQALRDKQAEMEQKLSDLQAASTEAQRVLTAAMAEQKSAFEAIVSGLESQVSQLSTDLADFKQRLSDKTQELADTTHEKDEIIADLRRKVMGAEATVKGVLFMRRNVDAFHLATTVIKEPVAACMMADGCTLVADTVSGLLLFSPHSELIQQLQTDDWKWPQGLVLDVVGKEILVSCMRKFDDKTFRRVIMHFSLVPDELHLYQHLKEAYYTDGPEEAERDTHVAKEKLARAKNGDLYLSLSDQVGSALYKLDYTTKKWANLSRRQGQNFTDLAVLGIQGAITDVLIVESRMGYLHKFSIRGDDIASRMSLAVVEKPACIAVDDAGTLFVQDIISGKVHQINSHMERVKDVCLIDDSVFSITANNGYLGVAVRQDKTVRIFRYADTFIDAVSSTAHDDSGKLHQ